MFITIDREQFVATREDVRLALEVESIESWPLWKPTYPRPLPTREGSGVAEELFAKGLCLPSGTGMSAADMERVVKIIRTQMNADFAHR